MDTAGQRCDRLVSLLDLYPTLSDLCNLGVPQNLKGLKLQGQSLKPLLIDPRKKSDRIVCTTYRAITRFGPNTGDTFDMLMARKSCTTTESIRESLKTWHRIRNTLR